MDIRALRSFLTVLELTSFSRAAESLGFTQSAISQQIATLEREIGATLVVRRPVGPTRVGERFAEHAREILATLDAARADTKRLMDLDLIDPVVRVGLSPAADDRLMTDAMSGRATHASHFLVGEPAMVAERFNLGAVDLAVVDGVTAPSDPLAIRYLSGTSVRVVRESSLSVLMPVDHPFARRRGVDLAALGAALWVDAPAGACPSAALGAAARERLRLGIRYDGARRATLHALVRSGRGLACEPADSPVGPGLVLVPLRSPRLTHRIEVWWHEPDRRAVLEVKEGLVAPSAWWQKGGRGR